MIIHASISWLFPFYFHTLAIYLSPRTTKPRASTSTLYFSAATLSTCQGVEPTPGTPQEHPSMHLDAFFGLPRAGTHCDQRVKESHKLSYCHIKLRRLSFKLGEMTWSQWAKDFFCGSWSYHAMPPSQLSWFISRLTKIYGRYIYSQMCEHKPSKITGEPHLDMSWWSVFGARPINACFNL